MICRSDSQLLSGIGERAVSPGGRGHAPPLRPEDEIARGARAPQRPMLPGGDGLGPHPALSHGEREKDERQPARRAGPTPDERAGASPAPTSGKQEHARSDGLGPHPALSRGEREFKKRGPPGAMGFFGPPPSAGDLRMTAFLGGDPGAGGSFPALRAGLAFPLGRGSG